MLVTGAGGWGRWTSVRGLSQAGDSLQRPHACVVSGQHEGPGVTGEQRARRTLVGKQGRAVTRR